MRRDGLILVLVGAVACSDDGSAAESSGGGSTSMAEPTGSSTGMTSVASTDPTSGPVSTGSSTGDPIFDVPSPDGGEEPPGNLIPETCEEAEQYETTVGCLFYAVDSDLVVVYDQLQFAVAVANVQTDQEANVVIEADDGAGYAPVEPMVTVDPLDLYVFLPDDRHIDGTGVRVNGSYRITSDVPIIAYQFNPYEAGESFTSDAALLYPVASWDTLHYALNQHKINTSQDVYTTVIAAEDGTDVTITSPVTTQAGGGVPAGSPDVPFTVTIDEGDVLQVGIANALEDPTGTIIESQADHPIAVFSGNTCALIPDPSGACDHLHEQLFGVRLWGERFVASRMPVRSTTGSPEASVWQLVASEDATTITFTASAVVTGVPGASVMLDAGEELELEVSGTFEDPGDFTIEADAPIAVANYMTGSSTVMPGGRPSLGDPSIVQLAPVEQFLPRYVILVPPAYWMWDEGVITRPEGVEIRLDGTAIPDTAFIPVGNEYEVARVPLEDGVHVLEGDEPFGIIVAGYDDDDSYAYLGGAGTAQINPVPEG